MQPSTPAMPPSARIREKVTRIAATAERMKQPWITLPQGDEIFEAQPAA
jgi:hypothetical protein